MTNPTSNFGWQMPTNTDLVTDLPADFEVFGQAVDTSMADLKGGTTGQILSKATNADMDFTWIANDQGDITAVNVTSPITGGGTAGAVTVGIQDATTSVKGAVQLSDSTSTTSSVLASTPTATKSAYDLAAAAVPKSTVTTKGDLIGATASATVARLAVGADGSTLVANSAASTGLSWAMSPAFAAGKNRIINGDFGVWQRGTSFSNPSGTYTTDRWMSAISGGSGGTVSQQTFTTGTAPVAGYEGTYFCRYASAAGATYIEHTQRIEDVRAFAGQTVIYSFWAKATSSVTFTPLFRQNFGSGGSANVDTSGSAQVIASSSWTRYTVSVSIPSIAGKTIGTGSYLGVFLYTSGGTTASNTVDFWGHQFEAGSVATAFQTATGTIQGELAACQRYYYRAGSTTLGSAGMPAFGATQSATSAYFYAPLPVPMRIAPTSIDYSNVRLVNYGVAAYSITSITLDTSSTTQNVGVFTADGASGMTANRPIFIYGTGSAPTYIGFSAEL